MNITQRLHIPELGKKRLFTLIYSVFVQCIIKIIMTVK